MANSSEQSGTFFHQKRKYTRHLRPEDEFSGDDDVEDALFTAAAPAPKDHVPLVDNKTRARLRRLEPTHQSFYCDPIMDYDYMPATPKEIVNFTQDLLSKKTVEILNKKRRGGDDDVIDELFLVDDEDDKDHNNATASTTSSISAHSIPTEKDKISKNSRRKKKRAQQRNQLLFHQVPKVPRRYDHFFYIPRNSRHEFAKDVCVRECCDLLTPYLHLSRDDWASSGFSLSDIRDVVCMSGMFYVKTYSRVEGGYTVHVYSDMKQPDNDSQLLVYDTLLFVVCGRIKDESCYCMVTYFFMKNER